jgi:SAM-dependent methyltransferase
MPNTDAYGALLIAHEEAGDDIEIVERDDGFIDAHEGVWHYFTEFDDWFEEEQEAIGYASGHVLDIGCAAGRVCLHLQDEGFKVTGIDNSPGAIRLAKQRGVKNAVCRSITQIDKRLAPVETYVMFGHNFGLFGNERRARWLLRKFKSLCSGDGMILATSRDTTIRDLPADLAYRRQNRQKGRLPGQMRVRIRYRNIYGPWLDFIFASKDEVVRIIEGTGWQVSHFIDGHSGSFAVVLERS